jgi:hypothetical protein
MVEDRFLKRLRKKGRKGLRGWPIATVAFYGPNLSQATKVAVGIVPSENAEVEELRDWKVDRGDIRSDPDIAREMLEFIQEHQVKSGSRVRVPPSSVPRRIADRAPMRARTNQLPPCRC